MGKSKHGKIEGQWVPLRYEVLDCPAWRVMSHGARSLYVALKRRHPGGRNIAYVSFRDAMKELKSSKRKIADWFRELQHYGFIVLHQHGCLGVDGKGKAPHWRLTELGSTSKASADGLFEPPTRDFLKWDGTPFEPRRLNPSEKWEARKHRLKNPGSGVGTRVVPASDTPPVPASDTPQTESGSGGVDIETVQGGSGVEDITRLTTPSESQDRAPASPPPPSEGSLEDQNSGGHFEGESNVVHIDPRIAALEAAEKRRKLR